MPPTSQLLIAVYGDKGKTEQLPLTSDVPITPDMFQPGQRVDLKVYYLL